MIGRYIYSKKWHRGRDRRGDREETERIDTRCSRGRDNGSETGKTRRDIEGGDTEWRKDRLEKYRGEK